ncbi:MAG: hypothetical protein PWQ75_1953 [Methanolobus sp.]|jgi:hypothetical protein|uniref:hypothetical protein n=1 Tax=Methanolobus sp. TaxID=1874737 RepID=UPI0024AAEEFE|nr:hypothetical protein [Methanolobus sp.]MDI3485267.1 hypothetical protein [Methanolobus sp.]MDK2832201.1 hypothetical protein [Methanolobus sp.]
MILDEKVTRVDIRGDFGLSAIIIFPLIMMFILIPLSYYYSVFGILMYAIWYLSFAVIVLQDRTTIETEQNTIRINRLLFGPRFINKNDITKTEVKKNIHNTYRVLWYALMVAILMNLLISGYHRVQENILHNYPTNELFFSLLSSSIIIVFFCSLFINMESRLRYPSFLEVTANNGKYKFYTH